MTSFLKMLRRPLGPEQLSLPRLTATAVFAFGLVVTLQFGIPPESPARALLGPTILWAAILVTVSVDVRAASLRDENDGFLDLIRVHSSTGRWFAARITAATVSAAVVAAPLVVVTDLAFTPPLTSSAVLTWLAATGGIIGLSSWSLVLNSVASNTRSAEIVTGVLLFPLVVPQTIAAVRLGSHFSGANTMPDPLTGVVLLIMFDLIAVGVSLMLIEYAVSE